MQLSQLDKHSLFRSAFEHKEVKHNVLQSYAIPESTDTPLFC